MFIPLKMVLIGIDPYPYSWTWTMLDPNFPKSGGFKNLQMSRLQVMTSSSDMHCFSPIWGRACVLPGSSRLPMSVNILDIITISENQHHFQPNYAKIFQHYPKFDCCFHTLGCNEVLLVEWKWAWMINWYKLQSWSDSGQTDCILGQLQVIPNHILDHFGTCIPDRKHQTHSKFHWLSLDLVIILRYSNPEKLILLHDCTQDPNYPQVSPNYP